MKNTIQFLYIWSRKIHRLTMWFSIVMVVFMGGTGTLLEAEVGGEKEWLTSRFNLVLVRQLHGSYGKWLIILLFIMIATGLMMWGYPILIKKISSKNNQQS